VKFLDSIASSENQFVRNGQLVGIAGKMKINIAGGKHSFEFEYTLPKRE